MKTETKCEKFQSADEAIASLGGYFQNTFAAISAKPATPVSRETQGNGGELALIAMAADELEERPQAAPAPVFNGTIQPSIYCSKGAPLSMWNSNGAIEVVLRDGNGNEHFGKLSAPLNAEGGFGPKAEPQDEAFARMVYDNFIAEERKVENALAAASASGVAPSRHNDRNYTHRATCLWTSRSYTGAPHSRAFMIVEWSAMSDGFQYPREVLLMDGNKLWSFKMEREQAGGNRPQWKGRAA